MQEVTVDQGAEAPPHEVAEVLTPVRQIRFPAEAEHVPLAAQAMLAIDRVLEAGHPLVAAFSSGKDSSALANMALVAAATRIREGKPCPPVLVIHSDTGVENPEVRNLADGELDKMVSFANQRGIPLEVRVGKPALYVSWPVRVIGGRALPSFPNSSRDCSMDWKVAVGNRLQSEVFADLRAEPGQPQPVLMTGVRIEESTARAAGIAARGERADEIWVGSDGRLHLSPIINWTSDDVWTYLGYAGGGLVESYSDFGETMRFYRDAGGSSCAVVGDMQMDQAAAKEKGGCGARSGCWSCVRVQKDKSLEQMITSDLDRYGYMRGLNRLRDFLANTQYDWGTRTYLGRSIDDNGDVAIQADVYSPSMLEELLRYTLTLQMREMVRAARKGEEPRFNIIGYRELIAIDALWSLYGLHKPFHALHVFNEIRSGKFLDVPQTVMVERTPVPRYGKLHVGREWEEDRQTGDPKRDRMLAGGIRSPVHEMFSESCGFDVKQTSSGDLVTAWDTTGSFEVDEEGAADFVELMGDEYIEKYHNDEADRTVAVTTYLGMGFLMPAHASLGRWHEIARRTQWMQRHGLVGEVQRERLLTMMDMQAAGVDPFAYQAVERWLATDPADRPQPLVAAPADMRIEEDGSVAVAEPAPSEIASMLSQGFDRHQHDEQQPDLFGEQPGRRDVAAVA